MLRTDNGGKYVNNNFTSYYTTQSIQMQHTVPYTPQQNGVAERKNCTLKEMANCMIQSMGLSLLENSMNRQRMLSIDGNSEDDRKIEDKVQRGE